MNKVKKIEISGLGEGENGTCLAERLLEGSQPVFTSWEQDHHGAMVRSGVWASTESKQIAIRGSIYEFCHILEGVVEVQEDSGESKIFRAGDSFVIKPNFTGTWKTIEAVKKVYVLVDTAAQEKCTDEGAN
ncbi:cupin domain-containing protein [Herbaspirillum sp. RV1423]|uniref:cupin domain-containing protein n=1 Tax=Herbaspirillum sp. RV1423 TaxID=1443993 RepID=UPI0004B68D66|nr:cupin domain-containing protein [Herbaspirillum sp. RV1423]